MTKVKKSADAKRKRSVVETEAATTISLEPTLEEAPSSSSRRNRLPRRCSTTDTGNELGNLKKDLAEEEESHWKQPSAIVAGTERNPKKKKKKQHSVAKKEASLKNPGEDVAAASIEVVAAATTPPTIEVKDPVSSTDNKEEEKLVVYSNGHRHLVNLHTWPGNIDFRATCEAAKFEYLALDATPASKDAVVKRIIQKYRYYGLSELEARAKIIKYISDRRGFFEKLTTEADRIQYAHLEPYKRQGYCPPPRRDLPPTEVTSRTRPHRSHARATEAPPPTESPFLHEFTKGAYIEELAFHHCGVVADDDALERLLPLPPPPSDIPVPPPHASITWHFDAETRVYLGDFTSVDSVPREQKWFIGSLMERDDISVILEGLYEKTIDVKSFLEKLGGSFGATPYAKFRQFARRQSPDTGLVEYEEQDGYIEMDVQTDYLNYLARTVYGGSDFKSCPFDLQRPIETHAAVGSDAGITVDVAADAGIAIDIAADASATMKTDTPDAPVENTTDDKSIYMTDVEGTTRFPRFDREYKNKFKMKEILPGGAWCLMNHLPEPSRPFMGPNLYICPGGGFTQMHQDGHGTVDSGHSNLNGYNEVVMLRRLPECHKRKACQLIPSRTKDGSKRKRQATNILFRLPHDDGRDDKLLWPETTTIKSWKDMGYCPSVFILKPGQHLIINKGRLHAFRKLTFDTLRDEDCHAKLRDSMVQELTAKGINRPPLCISVAFDWSFSGITPEGINRELAATLESASLCRKFVSCKSLAIPETAILEIANKLPAQGIQDSSDGPVFPELNDECELSYQNLAPGILPSLKYVTGRDLDALEWKGVPKSDLPDTYPKSSRSSIDPFGNDYFCKICSHELANTYFHCKGCETILLKDFNICIKCFQEEAYYVNMEMNPYKAKLMASHVHHFGKPQDRCSHISTACRECSFCKKCSFGTCACHKSFERRCRFYPIERQQARVEHCIQVTEGNGIKYAVETEHRLRGEVMIPMQVNVAEGVPDGGNAVSFSEMGSVTRNACVVVSNEVIDEINEDVVLRPPPYVELKTVEKFSGDFVESDIPLSKQEQTDNMSPPCQVFIPEASADIVDDDEWKQMDDFVEISPSKKLRTDNLEGMCGTAISEDVDDDLPHQTKTSDFSEGEVGESQRRKRSDRNESLDFVCQISAKVNGIPSSDDDSGSEVASV